LEFESKASRIKEGFEHLTINRAMSLRTFKNDAFWSDLSHFWWKQFAAAEGVKVMGLMKC
jgi:hypothetical protein